MNIRLDDKTKQFTEVYNDYYTLVYSTVYGKIGNHDEALDICQEVFIRFYEKYETVENPRKWLYGTLRNVVLEYFKTKKRKEVDIDEVFNDVGMSFVNGFRDTRIIVEEALNSEENFVNERDRIIFDLVTLSNFTFVEIGKQLGISERMVRYHYHQVANRIVKYFEKKGIKNLEDLL